MANFLSSFSVLNLAMNAIGYILHNKVVSLYSAEEGAEVLADCSIIRCTVSDKARLMEHPLEMGSKIIDHKVFEPITANLQIAMPISGFETECATLKELYRKGTMLSLQTKAYVYDNLQIAGIPHEETAENINRLVFNIELREAQVTQSVYVDKANKVKSKSDAPTKKVGQVQSKSDSALFSMFGGLFK